LDDWDRAGELRYNKRVKKQQQDMEAPQIIVICLIAAYCLIVNLIKSGESIQYGIVYALIDWSVLAGLLVCGGFLN